MSDVKEWLVKRATVQFAEANAETDAFAKSLRGYGTSAHPLLIERLTVHYPSVWGYSKIIRGKTFTYLRKHDNWSGSRVMNFCFQSFYDQEIIAESEANVIYPSLSTKTVVHNDLTLEEMTMRDEVESLVMLHQSSLGDESVALRHLASSQLGPTIVSNLLDDFKSSRFSSAVVMFLQKHQLSFPALETVEVRGREHRSDLLMRTKYYPSRDDNRAYCQDKNVLRTLVGACLHSLFYPKDENTRRRLHRSRVIPSGEKDLLEFSIPIDRREDNVTLLILGDVSNFTGSFGNSWLMLYSMALDASESLKNKHTVFGVGSSLLVASWFEILALYLYLTVGVPCFVEDLDEYHSLPGGFLGVNANITTSLVALALILHYTLDRLSGECTFSRCQIGGDDFAFALTLSATKAEWATDLIRSTMTDYVGHLKELKVIELDTCDDGVIDDESLFCKKRIELTRSRQSLHIRSEDSIPIPGVLSPTTFLRRPSDQVEAWRELDSALKVYDMRNPENRECTDALRRLFLQKYPYVRGERVTLTRSVSPQVRIEHIQGTFVTYEALKVIYAIPEREISYIELFKGFKSKLRHASMLELVRYSKVELHGEDLLLVLHPDQVSLLEVNKERTELILRPDELLVKTLSKLVKI